MLQQTRVKTVLPYYEAFLARFPTLEALACAHVDEVLALWSGLGYYRRARQMHQAAGEIVCRGDGFPASAHGLLRLPGVGPYTAAAVASIAFGEVVPVLDGNVERLLCRYLAMEEDPKRRQPREVLLAKAAEFLDPHCPGDGNQALMELGATVCLPRGPKCHACPLEATCQGYRKGDPRRYPPPRRRRQSEKISWSMALVERRGRVLFFRRAETCDVLPGMWEIPNVPHASDLGELDLGAPDLGALESGLAASYGGVWNLQDSCFRIRHSITYRSMTLHVHPARVRGSSSESRDAAWISADERDAAWISADERDAAWISADERDDYGISSMFEKILKRWRKPPT